MSQSQSRDDRRARLAREVDEAAGRRVLLDFLAWTKRNHADMPLALFDFWKERTGGYLEGERTMTVEVEHKPEPRRTMTVEVEHKPEPRRTMTVEVERSK
jgi:hypothetical protein